MPRIKLAFQLPDVSTVDAMTSELLFVRQHHDVIRRLMTYEGESMIPVKLSDELSSIGIITVERTPLSSTNAFPTYSECTSYEPDAFNYGLLAADYINYLAAVRNHYSRATDFGGTQDWVVFIGYGSTVVRVRAIGILSRLQTTYMDAVTRTIAQDAGVTLPRGNVLFIIKAASYDDLRAKLQD